MLGFGAIAPRVLAREVRGAASKPLSQHGLEMNALG